MSQLLSIPPSLKSATPLAQITTLFLSSSLSGTSLALSVYMMPRLLSLPTPLMLREWAASFRQGSAYMPPQAIVASAGYLYLYFVHRGSAGVKSWGYLSAAAFTFGIIPYTLAVMGPTNRMLQARAKVVERVEGGAGIAVREEGGADEIERVVREEMVLDDKAWVVEREGSKYLVDHWASMNLMRSVMLAVASLIGLVVTV